MTFTLDPLLRVNHLTTRFHTPDGDVQAVNGISFDLYRGESVGIVGESGSGKSQIFMSIMGLLASNGKAQGSVEFCGQEILNLPLKKLNAIRGSHLSMIFQDPMTSLNPYMTVGRQLVEVLLVHKKMSYKEAERLAIEMLEHVRIPEAKRRFKMYPHEFSGGMRQRVMIAMALLCSPELLIADEPTTALDVTVQAQVLDLLKQLQRELGTTIIMITHDLGVVANICDRIFVVYAGRIIESGPTKEIFLNPQHPYTQGLIRSTPRVDEGISDRLTTIAGQPPNLQHLPPGCPFAPRCDYRMVQCIGNIPHLRTVGDNHQKACHLEIL